MSYLSFLLRARTAHSIHSPYLYWLYTEVITARLPRRRRRELGLRTPQETLLYRLNHSLHPGEFLFVEHPHRHEAHWHALCAQPQATACLDLYHSGIILFNPKLQKQTLLLR